MTQAHYEHFPHDADVGVRGFGATPAAAFEQAGLAMTAVIADPAEVTPAIPVEITCEAPDKELLLADFLNALIYEMAARSMLFSRFNVRIDGTRLHATVWGEPVDIARHEPTVEAKGATLTGLRVAEKSAGTWLAQCVIDV